MDIILSTEELMKMASQIAKEAVLMAGPAIAKQAIEEFKYTDGCLTRKEAAEWVNCSYNTICRYISDGIISTTVAGTIPKSQLINLNKKKGAVTPF